MRLSMSGFTHSLAESVRNPPVVPRRLHPRGFVVGRDEREPAERGVVGRPALSRSHFSVALVYRLIKSEFAHSGPTPAISPQSPSFSWT
jgi:hypothetical protein